VETAVTTKRNPLSIMYARAAFQRLVPALPRVLLKKDDLVARGDMLLGAALAGTAIENSMLGATHAAANPLTAHYGVVHGTAVGIMLPHVVRINAEDPDARQAYAELSSAPEIACVSDGLDEAVEALVARLEALLNAAGIPRSLEELSVPHEDIPCLAEEAARQWTAQFNPRPLKIADFEALYRAAFKRRGDGDR
jgi:alcohol dehydrogenase